MSYRLQIGQADQRERVSWKLARHAHGTKDVLVFENTSKLHQWLRHRPWLTRVRIVDETGNVL